jgi:hypothetical protein
MNIIVLILALTSNPTEISQGKLSSPIPPAIYFATNMEQDSSKDDELGSDNRRS